MWSETKILAALLMLEIWSPDKWRYYRGNDRDSLMLSYKTRGIVLHDRELNYE